MSKKYRKQRGKQKHKGYTKHHILWCKKKFEENVMTKALREHPALILLLKPEAHTLVHRHTPGVPPPSVVQAHEIMSRFFPSGEWKADLNRFIQLCSEVGASKTAKALRFQYKYLTHILGPSGPFLIHKLTGMNVGKLQQNTAQMGGGVCGVLSVMTRILYHSAI